MSYYGTMQIVDETGWSKTFSLEKALTMIGSAAFNDIVLSEHHGSGVAAVHLQLIRMQAGTRGFRLVNLVNEPLSITLSRARGDAVIPPNGSRDLEDGDAVRIGDFTITFYLRAVNGVSIEKRSENIGIRLEIPGVTLRPGVRLAGLLTVMNFGEEKRSQFEIELEGLPSDCFQIDPAPLLYPGGEEKLQIRFYHRGIRPPAGECPIRLRASAVSAYPTEEVILPLVLDVEPVYRYKVDLMEEQTSMEKEFEPVLPLPKPNIAVPEPVLPSFTEPSAPAVKSIPPVIESPEPAHAPSVPPAVVAEPIPAAASSTAKEAESSLEAKPDPSVTTGSTQTEKLEAAQPEPQAMSAQQAIEEPEADWWTEDMEELPAVAHSDPFADLKRGIKPKLSVEKANVQVLKAAPEELWEKKDEALSDNTE